MIPYDIFHKDVIDQLTVNNPENVDYITFNYSEEEVAEKFDYFEDCRKRGLSAYKALALLSYEK
jgi:hypothetical protein